MSLWRGGLWGSQRGGSGLWRGGLWASQRAGGGGGGPSTPPDPADIVVVLAVASTTHASSTATKSMLLDAGFLDENVIIHSQVTPIPTCDIILVPRGSRAAGDAAEVLQAYQGGVPVVAGMPDGSSQPADVGFSYHAKWSGGVYAQSAMTDIDVVDAGHFITEGTSLGLLTVNASSSYQVVVDAIGDHIGSVLATGQPTGGPVAGKAILIPIEAGISDMDTGTTPARGVFCGFLYGGQGAYTADARNLITRSIQWCLMG